MELCKIAHAFTSIGLKKKEGKGAQFFVTICTVPCVLLFVIFLIWGFG